MKGMRELLSAPKRLMLEGEDSLRLLTAMEVLEARREGAELAEGDREKALCANACLLARALERKGKPLFSSGRAVLEKMRVEEIARMAELWGEFNREVNPSVRLERKELDGLKKAWSTRRKSALCGACSVHFRRCLRRDGSEK